MLSWSCYVMSIPEWEQICLPLQCNGEKRLPMWRTTFRKRNVFLLLADCRNGGKTRLELSSSPCFRVSQTLTWKPSRDRCVCIPSRSRFSPVALCSSGSIPFCALALSRSGMVCRFWESGEHVEERRKLSRIRFWFCHLRNHHHPVFRTAGIWGWSR
jgi:hypothetical protein